MEKPNLEQIRHSTAHILAQAVQNLFKNVKLGIGPTIDNGFYYDFDLQHQITEEDLKKIESEMKRIIKEKQEFKKHDITKAQAIKLFEKQPYKLQLIEELDEITYYENGNFKDLCKGQHVKNTSELGFFKLLKISGAYWKGDAKNKQLQRIYGTAWESKEKLKEHLHMLEEAKKRDHTKLGRELGIYITNPAIGKGLPLFSPKGATIKRTLQRWIEDEEIKRGYQFTDTPILAKTDLYEISGHLSHYKDSMFILKNDENEELALRPMTCPYQFMIYKSEQRSYKDLPIKYAETSLLFRKELSGELHGLIRIWQFTLADGHLICRPDQIEKEFKGVLDLIEYILKTLGLKDYWYRFSKWDPKNKDKYIDNPKAWEESQKIMKEILDNNNLEYIETEDDAAFYGPKLDIQMKNVWGKEDTMFTVQIDFALPERFDMTYINEKSEKARPMVIHRSSIGCYERTIAMLIEHYAGKFPVWLSPVQVSIITVADRHREYANDLANELKQHNIRAEVDSSAESIGKKVRNNVKMKIPYLITIGDKELGNPSLAIRTRENKVIETSKEEFINKIKKEIEEKC